MAAKDKLSPATTSGAYDTMAPRWAIIDTLLGGTEAMRLAGEVYCPKHTEETDDGYKARLAGSVLVNMVEQTLVTLAGKPFAEPVKINDDVPKELVGEAGVLDDVDLQGNSLDVFCREWFKKGLAKAFCHVLVDMPAPPEVEPGKQRTLADDRAEKRRPYWVLVQPECVLFARASVVDGVEKLEHVRILESYTEQDGFAEVVKHRIRVLEPGKVELWEPHPTKKRDGQAVWEKRSDWATGLDFIPMVTFYAHREDFMMAKPPLLDLAYLNATHWQSTADQRHILTVARFPILACSGASGDDSAPITIGPNRVLYNDDAAGEFYYVEHTGASIEAGRNDLKDLEEKMAGYGADFLKSKPGNPTATAKALDSAESNSDLGAMAGVFEDAVAQALSITMNWLGDKDGKGGTIEVLKDFNKDATEEAGLKAIQEARKNKDLSRETLLEALRLRGYLPEDFDPDLDMEQLLDEQSAMLAQAAADLDPAGGNTPPEPGQPKPPAKPGEPAAKPPAKAGAKPQPTGKKRVQGAPRGKADA